MFRPATLRLAHPRALVIAALTGGVLALTAGCDLEDEFDPEDRAVLLEESADDDEGAQTGLLEGAPEETDRDGSGLANPGPEGADPGSNGECGDGITSADEGCDAGASNGPGYGCTPDCMPNVCGDGYALQNADEPEQCDGEDLSGMTCRDLGFSGGTLACTAECGLDRSGCW